MKQKESGKDVPAAVILLILPYDELHARIRHLGFQAQGLRRPRGKQIQHEAAEASGSVDAQGMYLEL